VGVESWGETYIHVCALVVERAVGHADEAGFLDNTHKTWAEDQWLRLSDDTEQVPPGGKPNGFLQTACADIADGRGTRVRQEKNRDRRLLEGKQETDIGVETREEHVTASSQIVDLGEDGVDKRIQFNGVCVHLLLFALMEHGVLWRSWLDRRNVAVLWVAAITHSVQC
jgi:hypothetical protein